MRDKTAAPSPDEQQVFCRPDAELQEAAQRELAAFYAAVTEMYGPEEAMRAALGWIEKLERADQPVGGRPPDWREMTIAAAGGLASRVVNQSASRRQTVR